LPADFAPTVGVALDANESSVDFRQFGVHVAEFRQQLVPTGRRLADLSGILRRSIIDIDRATTFDGCALLSGERALGREEPSPLVDQLLTMPSQIHWSMLLAAWVVDNVRRSVVNTVPFTIG
jgi:hypothetical protein